MANAEQESMSLHDYKIRIETADDRREINVTVKRHGEDVFSTGVIMPGKLSKKNYRQELAWLLQMAATEIADMETDENG